MTDEQAMWRVQMHDDPQAFAELVARWQGPIQRLGARLLGDAQRAEDIAQETFARLFNVRKKYEGRSQFSTFIWRMALNLCYDELRRQERRPETPLDAPEHESRENWAGHEPAPDAQAALDEQSQLVRRALMELPELYRSIVVLRHYEDLKFREIAQVLDLPEGTVKSRMAEALSRLERRLRVFFQPPMEPHPSPTANQGDNRE